jgi:hypothetical protein
LAVIALCVALSGSATAALMITGKQIKNNSVAATDVKNGSLTGMDVRDKSLTANDFSGSVQGPQGPQGSPGPLGPAGPRGPKGDTGAAGISGIEQVLSESTTDSNDKTQVVTCPPGKRVISGGGEVDNAHHEVFLRWIVPGTSHVTVRAEEQSGGSAQTWQLYAWALCGYVAD